VMLALGIAGVGGGGDVMPPHPTTSKANRNIVFMSATAFLFFCNLEVSPLGILAVTAHRSRAMVMANLPDALSVQ